MLQCACNFVLIFFFIFVSSSAREVISLNSLSSVTFHCARLLKRCSKFTTTPTTPHHTNFLFFLSLVTLLVLLISFISSSQLSSFSSSSMWFLFLRSRSVRRGVRILHFFRFLFFFSSFSKRHIYKHTFYVSHSLSLSLSLLLHTLHIVVQQKQQNMTCIKRLFIALCLISFQL